PAANAFVSVGAATGSTPTTFGVPGGDPGNQTAAADRNQQRVDLRRLLFELHAEGTLPEQRLILIERVDRHGTGFFRPCHALGERVRIAIARDGEIGAIVADAR